MVIIIINYQLLIINYPTMKPDNFILYYSQWPALKELSAQELGVLLQAIFRTMGDESVDDILTSLDGKVRMAFQFLMVQIKYDNEKYQKKCELNRQKALKRWGKDANDATAYLAMHNNNKDNNSNNNKDNNSNNNKNNNQEVVGRINSSYSSSTVSDIANGNEEEDEEENFSMMMKEKFLPWFNSILKNADSKIQRIQDFNDQRKEDLLRFTRNTESGRRGQQVDIQPQGQMVVVPKALLSDTGSIDFASLPH